MQQPSPHPAASPHPIAPEHPARPAASSARQRPGLALERVDELLRDRTDRSRTRLRLGALLAIVGLLATMTAVILPGAAADSRALRILSVGPGVVGILMGTLVALVALLAWTRLSRDEALRTTGVMTRGWVRRVEGNPTSAKQVVHFEFRDRQATVRRAEGPSRATEAAERWAAGDVGLLLYDPRNPGQVLWLGVRSTSPSS